MKSLLRSAAASLLSSLLLSTWLTAGSASAATSARPAAPANESTAARTWTQLVSLISALPLEKKLGFASLAFNVRSRYASDGDVDDWASPLALLARGAGDCEDHAIAKFFLLLEAGVPEQQLRLGYVRLRNGRGFEQVHMVTLYYEPGQSDPLVADNLTDNIERLSDRSDMRLVFSFSRSNVWDGSGQITPFKAQAITKWSGVSRQQGEQRRPRGYLRTAAPAAGAPR